MHDRAKSATKTAGTRDSGHVQQDLVLEMRVTDTSGYTLITFERREKEVEQHRKR